MLIASHTHFGIGTIYTVYFGHFWESPMRIVYLGPYAKGTVQMAYLSPLSVGTIYMAISSPFLRHHVNSCLSYFLVEAIEMAYF